MTDLQLKSMLDYENDLFRPRQPMPGSVDTSMAEQLSRLGPEISAVAFYRRTERKQPVRANFWRYLVAPWLNGLIRLPHFAQREVEAARDTPHARSTKP